MPQLRAQLQSSLGSGYTLERSLGGGGVPHVFVATDTTLGREVVVKVLPPEAAAVSAERYKREIVLAAKLQHPHIVPLLSAGATADGLPSYTMPFVEGEPRRPLTHRFSRRTPTHIGPTSRNRATG